MSVCDSRRRSSNAATNFSNSSSVSDPISLHGSRCSASSVTPPLTSHERACPLNFFIDSSAGVPAGRKQLSYRLLHPVHLLNLIPKACCNRIPLQFSICSQQPILNLERLATHIKRAHLLVMRQF